MATKKAQLQINTTTGQVKIKGGEKTLGDTPITVKPVRKLGSPAPKRKTASMLMDKCRVEVNKKVAVKKAVARKRASQEVKVNPTPEKVVESFMALSLENAASELSRARVRLDDLESQFYAMSDGKATLFVGFTEFKLEDYEVKVPLDHGKLDVPEFIKEMKRFAKAAIELQEKIYKAAEPVALTPEQRKELEAVALVLYKGDGISAFRQYLRRPVPADHSN